MLPDFLCQKVATIPGNCFLQYNNSIPIQAFLMITHFSTIKSVVYRRSLIYWHVINIIIQRNSLINKANADHTLTAHTTQKTLHTGGNNAIFYRIKLRLSITILNQLYVNNVPYNIHPLCWLKINKKVFRQTFSLQYENLSKTFPGSNKLVK